MDRQSEIKEERKGNKGKEEEIKIEREKKNKRDRV